MRRVLIASAATSIGLLATASPAFAAVGTPPAGDMVVNAGDKALMWIRIGTVVVVLALLLAALAKGHVKVFAVTAVLGAVMLYFAFNTSQAVNGLQDTGKSLADGKDSSGQLQQIVGGGRR